MADPKGFLKHMRVDPKKRPIDERVQDWNELYVPMGEDELRAQATRCMDCGVPFCQSATGCPVENLIPDWNELVSLGRWKDALKLLHSTNNFPEFTGRLCPAPCESACVLGINDQPVSIRVTEWNIVDRGFDEGWVEPVLPMVRTGKRVAVIGSGPAGLAAAQQLNRSGHSVTVLEKADRAGGLLRYGIPDFKMEKWVLERRLDQMRIEGVEFKTGVRVGNDLKADELLRNFDAVCLATGAETARDITVPGRELDGIHLAMDYLTDANRAGGAFSAKDKRVVILGGGDTGSDCLGTAHRQGARELHQFELLPQPPLERAASTPWPLWPMKLRTSHAHEEGCDRQWSVSTTRFSGENGRVQKLHAVRLAFQDGKLTPQPGSEFTIDADLVLLAMGFTGPVRVGLLESLGVELDARGNVKVDGEYKTSVPRVYAAGDVKRGASLIVWAIAEGRKMAAAVDRALER